MTRLYASFLLSIFVMGFFACDIYSRSVTQRADRAKRPSGDIVVGIVSENRTEPLLIKGVKLALEEINENGGLRLKIDNKEFIRKKMKIKRYDDKGQPFKAMKIARKIANDRDVVAVIGHSRSGPAISAAAVYQKNGIVYISPGATNPLLTKYGFDYVFRNIPSDNKIAYKVARYAVSEKVRSILIFHERSAYAEKLAWIFKWRAQGLGINIIATRSYNQTNSDFRPLIAEFTDTNVDAVFLSGGFPASGRLIKQTWAMGFEIPFFGGTRLDSPGLTGLEILTKGKKAIIVPTMFDHQESQVFVENFKKRYGLTPDSHAAQGYDAMKVLANAIELGGSAVPVKVSANLRFMKDWDSITGQYSFNSNGDVLGKKIFFKILSEGKLRIKSLNDV